MSEKNDRAASEVPIEARLSNVEALAEANKTYVEIEGLLLTGALNPAELGTALQSQPGAGSQRRAILRNMEGGGSRGLLPAAIQGGP